MRTFTIEVQAGTGDERDGWSVVGDAEIVYLGDTWTADAVAQKMAETQTRAIGEHWRVVVWEGAYDTAGQERRDSVAEFYADMLAAHAGKE